MSGMASTYRNFLILSQKNFTCTYLAQHCEPITPNRLYNFLKESKFTPKDFWGRTKDEIRFSPNGCLIVDDTVLDKRHSKKIEGAFRQYSGNAHGLVVGINVTVCLYYNPDLDECYILNYRIFDREKDGKTKLDHAADMFDSALERGVPFRNVLMDTWFGAKDFLLKIHRAGKIFIVPLKKNRKVNPDGPGGRYVRVEELAWTEAESASGKTVKIHGFPMDQTVKLFRIGAQDGSTDWIATNGQACKSAQEIRKSNALRWKIEQFFREVKQLTGVERCQCRDGRSQRNHIGLAFSAWAALKRIARSANVSVYRVKEAFCAQWLALALAEPPTALRAMPL